MTMAAALVSFGHAAFADRPWSRHLAFLPRFLAGSANPARHYTDALHTVAARPDDAVAIDVQLPFCPMLCMYCASDVTVTHDPREIDRYVDALEIEIGLVADHLAGQREVVQVHFGGGTPNYLSDVQLGRIVAAIRERFRLLPETESTIDCDPRRASADQLDALRALGFGHIRFGMADLQPHVQRAVGRMQSAAMMRDASIMAGEAGFETIGTDLLYGLPGQSEESLTDTLRQLIDMGFDRICCHQYVHRPAERRHQCAIDVEYLPEPQERAALFRTAVDVLTAAGYTWIGLDHFVLDTDELALAQATGELHCNVIGYTARPHAHVLGFGAGAIGDIDGTAVRNEPARAVWQQRLATGVLPVADARRRSTEDMQVREATVRLLCDLELRALNASSAAAADMHARLAPFAAQGLVALSEDRVAVTPPGRFALERLCHALQHPGPGAGGPS